MAKSNLHKTTLTEKFKAGLEIGAKGKTSRKTPRGKGKVVLKSATKAQRKFNKNDRKYERSQSRRSLWSF